MQVVCMSIFKNILRKIEQEMPFLIMKKSDDGLMVEFVIDVNTSVQLNNDERWVYLEAEILCLSEWDQLASVFQVELLRHAYRLMSVDSALIYLDKTSNVIKLFRSVSSLDSFKFDEVFWRFLSLLRAYRAVCEGILAEEHKVKNNVVIGNTV